MEPIQDTRATLVDLLDRVLDKGLVVYADVIISVAGVPLIGVNLRAALAGMETMLEYGMMRDWDESIRGWERDNRSRIAAGTDTPPTDETDGRAGREQEALVPALL